MNMAYIPRTALQPPLSTYLHALRIQLEEAAEAVRKARRTSKYQHDYAMHKLYLKKRQEQRKIRQQALIATKENN